MDNKYIPLYRKYRPQKLEEIVGQEHIKKALSNAIELNRISHAYLFTGPRGTGKTSTARIFAKSLNCVKGPTVSPCNECENCVNITNSVPIDVVEIDAASNRSVSDAEEIIQNVAMAPVHSRYKIYIIDEVHMLTPTAFNALLKTLEEPPENVIFILATTEVHKVLDTIKSRCQRFDFKRITTDDISKHLRYISDKEGFNISDDALHYIAQNSAGGMRDSIALLDQLSVLNSLDEQISVDDINRLLGRLSFERLYSLFSAIAKSNKESSLEILNDIYNSGNEPSQILSNLLDFLRNALVIKSVGTDAVSIVNLNEEQICSIKELVSQLETHQIVSLVSKCSTYIKELKTTSEPKLWLDVAIIDLSNLTENTRLDDMLKRIELLEAGNSSVGKKAIISAYNTPPTPVIKSEIKQNKNNIRPEGVSSGVTKEHEPKNTDSDVSEELISVPMSAPNSNIKALWVKFLDNISSFPSRAILKQQAIPVKISAEEIIISIKNPTWLKNFSPEGERFAFLTESARSMFGSEPKIIVRAPNAKDDMIQSSSPIESVSSSTPETLSVNKEVAKQALQDENSSVKPADEKKNDITKSDEASLDDNNDDDGEKFPNNKSFDRAYHSDNVNMVMELFEGKIIE